MSLIDLTPFIHLYWYNNVTCFLSNIWHVVIKEITTNVFLFFCDIIAYSRHHWNASHQQTPKYNIKCSSCVASINKLHSLFTWHTHRFIWPFIKVTVLLPASEETPGLDELCIAHSSCYLHEFLCTQFCLLRVHYANQSTNAWNMLCPLGK